MIRFLESGYVFFIYVLLVKKSKIELDRWEEKGNKKKKY